MQAGYTVVDMGDAMVHFSDGVVRSNLHPLAGKQASIERRIKRLRLIRVLAVLEASHQCPQPIKYLSSWMLSQNQQPHVRSVL